MLIRKPTSDVATLPQIARQFNVSQRLIRILHERGELSALADGKRLLFNRKLVERQLASLTGNKKRLLEVRSALPKC